MKRATAIICAALIAPLLTGCGARQGNGPAGAANTKPSETMETSAAARPVRVSAEDSDAAEPTVASAGDGTAYVSWVEHRADKGANVMVAHVDRDGKALTAPARVNPHEGEATAWRGDAPTLAVATDGALYVGWTARVEAGKHANDLLLSVSRDGGRSFGVPVKVNDDGLAVGHGMHSLAVATDGRIHVAWLDERNVVKPEAGAQAGGMKMEHMEANREVFVAYSSDGGRSFSKNQRVAKEACPCCKTSLAAGAGGRVFVGWRQVLPGEFRHIGVAASKDGGETFGDRVIVSDDRWQISACPVSGPALSLSGEGVLSVVWYTEGEKAGAGLYLAESRDDGRTFSEPRSMAKGDARGTPLLVAGGKGAATLVWESDEGGSPRVMAAPVAGEQPTALALPGSGELPSATLVGDQLLISYIAKINDRRSIWVIRKPLA